MKRFVRPIALQTVPSALAVACAAVLGLGIVAAMGLNPFAVLRSIADTAHRPPHGLRDDIAYVLFYATPLIFTGLSVAVAFRAGLFNIGGQGQVLIGSLLCGIVGWKCGSLPAAVVIPLCVVVSALGGAAWASIAGALKAWRGSHEVIITIMLNFLAVALTDAVVNGPWQAAGMTAQLPEVGEAARLPRLGSVIPVFPTFVQANASLFIALAACAGLWIYLQKSVSGYELRAFGHNPEAARAAGISAPWMTVRAMAISGGLAGLAATDFVLGSKYNYRQDDGMGYAAQAFIGIAVSLMGRNHPAGIVAAALLFGALQRMGLLLKGVPKDLIFILQAAVILFVICGNELFRRALARKAAPA